MSELTTTARPYARAIFELASETDTLTKWSETLQFMAAVVANEDARHLLDNPKLTKQEAANVLLTLCGEQLDEQAQNLAKLLAENSRIPVIPAISSLFEALKTEVEGSIDVQVTSAFEMSESAQTAMSDALKGKLGREVNLSVEIDTSIIGGVIIRAGDMVIDGSIQGRLQSMTQTLNG
jgi:F-type H+-transporting ATPase subunit delta